MDAWPSDTRLLAENALKNSRKESSKAKRHQPTDSLYPILRTGTLNAARLRANGVKWEWDFLPKSREGLDFSLSGSLIELVSPCEPEPTPPPSQITLERADQGAHFLRTRLPEADVAADTVRELIIQDTEVQREFDPYAGDVLATLPISDNATTHIVRPVGELGSILGIYAGLRCSPVTQLISSTLPIVYSRAFMTPILQIKTYAEDKSYVSIRTFGETILAQVQDSPEDLGLSDISRFTRADLGGKQPMDVDLDPHTSQFTLINSDGVISNFDFHGGGKHCNFTFPSSIVELPALESSFWRVSLADGTGCLRSSANTVDYVDFRVKDDPMPVFSCRNIGELICSMNSQASETSYLCTVVTNNELNHLDLRSPGKILSAVSHGRRHDRSLRFSWIQARGGAFGCLHSHLNGLVSLYDVRDTNSNDIRLLDMPLSLPAVRGFNSPHLGQLFLPSGQNDSFMVLQSQHNGALLSQRVTLGKALSYAQARAERPISDAVSPITDPRVSNKFDMSGVLGWCSAFGQPVATLATPPEEAHIDASTLDRDAVEKSHRLHTAYDLAMQLTQNQRSSRSQFLDGAQTRRNLDKEDLLPLVQPSWNYSISDTLQSLDSSLPSLLEDEKTENLDMISLCRDMRLSGDIYSFQPIPSIATEGSTDAVLQAAESLSLDEPPSIKFSYCKPNVDDDDTRSVGIDALGTRLLVNEWPLGGDPEAYYYQDPYSSSQEKPHFHAPAAQPAPAPVASLAPPVIAKAESRPLPPDTFSQPIHSLSQPDPVYSSQNSYPQGDFPSTQVLAGPFGGRKSANQHKKQKKPRMGGF